VSSLNERLGDLSRTFAPVLKLFEHLALGTFGYPALCGLACVWMTNYDVIEL